MICSIPRHLLACCLALTTVVCAQDLSDTVVLEKHEVEGTGNAVWVYYPKALTAGAKIPAVIIAPAGGSLYDGKKIDEADMAEHLPYAEAGFAVIGYEVSGVLPEDPTDDDVLRCAAAFAKRKGGVDDARDAARSAMRKHRFIDASQLYTAGHSSAGTQSLQLAQYAPSIKGCIAFAPVVDVSDHLGEDALDVLKDTGIPELVRDFSPHLHAAKIACPVFLFVAEDDDVVAAESIRSYADQLKAAGRSVTYVEVKSGGHYDSMIGEGIPQAIEWLKKQTARSGASAQ